EAANANDTEQVKKELEETKKMIREKDSILQKLKRAQEEKLKMLEEKEKQLEEKEKELDEEVNDITKQVFFFAFVFFLFCFIMYPFLSIKKKKPMDHNNNNNEMKSKDLKDRSELLIRERDDVKKQREHWQQLVDEQKERSDAFRKQQEDLDNRHKEVLELHRAITEEKQKLHDEKKRFLRERKRWEKEKASKNNSGSIPALAAQQKSNQNPGSLKPVSSANRFGAASQSYGNMGMGGSIKESRGRLSLRQRDSNFEYADSECAETVATDLESLNSISDDEEPETDDGTAKAQHLQLPINDYE
ncbi:hypothetical protein RFI_18047, partial [Reticulomyxa filosa]